MNRLLSVEDCLLAIQQSCGLSPERLEEVKRNLTPHGTDPRALGRELLQRGWLTPYQVNLVLQGRSGELRIGPYLVLERLGEGGTGEVFRARHEKLDREVALKVIRKELTTHSEVFARFERESRLISQLHHPNVVHALDAGPIGRTYILVMEYIDGRDLAWIVQETGPLAIERACDYIRQAAAGLQHIHEKGLVHRDIKPHNLIVSRPKIPVGNQDGANRGSSEEVIKILDLGLARLLPSRSHLIERTVTKDNSAMGTLDYMAPEQALDAREVDIRADIYSLGCTFYHLLIGRPPFYANMPAQVLLKHQMAPAPSVRLERPDVSAELAALIQRMMAKKPEDRFATPADVAAGLAKVPEAGRQPPVAIPVPVAAPPDGLAPNWTRKRVRIISALACLMVLGLVWFSWGRLSSPSKPSAQPGSKVSRSLTGPTAPEDLSITAQDGKGLTAQLFYAEKGPFPGDFDIDVLKINRTNNRVNDVGWVRFDLGRLPSRSRMREAALEFSVAKPLEKDVTIQVRAIKDGDRQEWKPSRTWGARFHSPYFDDHYVKSVPVLFKSSAHAGDLTVRMSSPELTEFIQEKRTNLAAFILVLQNGPEINLAARSHPKLPPPTLKIRVGE